MIWADLPSPLWVLGTDTGIGKTFVATCLARTWAALGPVTYRKPFQTGVVSVEDPEADAPAVRSPGVTVETGALLREPLSPLAAAEAEGRVLDLDALRTWTARPAPGRLLLEPAGGVLVPVGPGVLFLDWAEPLGFPAILVARGSLGTLNHTLLTCEALAQRGWDLRAVVLNPGPAGDPKAARDNARILATFLTTPVSVLEPE